jgi:AcrR family transcriptional regulator
MRDVTAAAGPDPRRPSGLRERKKMKTHQTIRREAFRLFDERGYASTTTEQIAEAAAVSASTFFRYFPSKESVLLADDLSAVILAALASQPAEMAPLTAFRAAVHQAYAQMASEEWEIEKIRQRLLYSLPELQAALRDEYNLLLSGVSEAMAARLGRGSHELELRVFAGAVIGAVMALGNRGPFSLDNVDAAMDFLESGLRLS